MDIIYNDIIICKLKLMQSWKMIPRKRFYMPGYRITNNVDIIGQRLIGNFWQSG